MTAIEQPADDEPAGNVPASAAPVGSGPFSSDSGGAAQPGLAWSWELDFETLLTALTTAAAWHRQAEPDRAESAPSETVLAEDVPSETVPSAIAPSGAVPATSVPAQNDPADFDQAEADLADYLDAVEAGRSRLVPLDVVAGRVAETLPAGPDLAGWLATSSARGLEDGALAGMAASYRRLASWAQAGELAVVAELASRSAAADSKIGVGDDGRPLRLADEACAQVSLALTMSQASASWWSDLGVTLAWRLAATGAALRAGEIDLGRARLIAEATAVLDEEAARAVEARVLPRAGEQTTGQLRAALRRAVIAADPEGAERRREEAERRAKVALYPDEEGTASLAGYSLPGIRAAAAMARITALARAMKASGAGGGIDLLRAQVFLGLLLGTLPYIPPAPDGPPDVPPGADPPDGDPLDDSPSDGPVDDPPGDGPLDDSPGGPAEDSPDGGRPGSDDPSSDDPGKPPVGDSDRPGQAGKGHGEQHDNRPRSGSRPATGRSHCGEPNDYGEPLERAGPPCDTDAGGGTGAADDELWPESRPPPAWPQVPAFLLAGPAAIGNLAPSGGGLLDLRVPWRTLAGESGEPGHLSRLGPVTPAQACHLAALAAMDGTVRWRVIVISRAGRALAVTRVPRRTTARAGPAQEPIAGLVGRITVTISQDDLTRQRAEDLPVMLARILSAAGLASERADRRAAADRTAVGRCAHSEASLAYRPSASLWEYVTARDLTCRFPTCRQPAWRCDLDHTTPYDKGGRTCSCNLGGLCRFHHQLKQHVRWRLAQSVPGTFTWTTPAGRAYVAEPDIHLVNDGLG